VVSILWISLVSIVFAPDTKKSLNILPKQKTFEKVFEIERKRLLGELPNDKKTIYEEGLKRKILPKIEFKISEATKSAELFLNPTPEILDQSPITVAYKKVIKNFPPKTSPQTIWIKFESAITKIKYKEILKFLSIALLPLVILLLLGVLFSWVIKGFTHNAEPISEPDAGKSGRRKR
jgi:hypothetical protein